MTATQRPGSSVVADVRRIAEVVAAEHAEEVDRDARFPHETIAALRESGLISAYVPAELGGRGAGLRDIADSCFELGRRCGASAMVFAMHQMQLACLSRHRQAGDVCERFLREAAANQLLIASVTSEVGTGGDLGRSVAALIPGQEGGRASFEKQAPTISYAEHADVFLTTLRRAPDANDSNQVLVLTRREETQLEPTSEWDTMGMRGTCSPGFIVRAEVSPDAVLPTPFAIILTETMSPYSWLLWAHVWLGIASDAFDRARLFGRDAARRSPDTASAVTARVSHLLTRLAPLRSDVRSAVGEFEAMDASPGRQQLHTMPASLRFNALKISSSEAATEVCHAALAATGIAGFRNTGPYSVTRHVRDTLSAPLMVANERLHSANGTMLMVVKEV
jgi:acyl-CoA dehydrogenase